MRFQFLVALCLFISFALQAEVPNSDKPTLTADDRSSDHGLKEASTVLPKNNTINAKFDCKGGGFSEDHLYDEKLEWVCHYYQINSNTNYPNGHRQRDVFTYSDQWTCAEALRHCRTQLAQNPPNCTTSGIYWAAGVVD